LTCKKTLDKSLATEQPDIAAQWHPTKNAPLTPRDVAPSARRKVWWKCPIDDDHEWQSTITNRSAGRGCPCCTGMKPARSNCLATLRPDIAALWHPTKNEGKTPFDVTVKSQKKAWWICPVAHDHVFQASIYNMVMPTPGCPYCAGKKVCHSNCLETVYPEIAAEWHPTKNSPITSRTIAPGSRKKVWWLCKKGHEWKTSVGNRTTNMTGCPVCRSSHGEIKIRGVLTKLGLPFKRQVRFDTCKHERTLPFDFLVKLSNRLGFLIEYQGEGHYQPVYWNARIGQQGARQIFWKVQKRDCIKRRWAKGRSIPLLLIPFWERDRIAEIVEEFVSDLKARMEPMFWE
jgi:hypothetical protein